MTELNTETTTTEKAAKPRKAKPRRKAAAPAPKKDSIFAGMTVANCADGCSEKGCVIGTPICSHPAKCGLQATFQHGDTLKKFNQAKRLLGEQKLDLTRA